MRGEILGLERRRFWCDEDKLKIIMSVGVGGATVTQVAQRHEVTRQQIYAWRHDLKKKGLWSPDAGALFYPLDMPVAAGVPTAHDTVAETSPPVCVCIWRVVSRICERGSTGNVRIGALHQRAQGNSVLELSLYTWRLSLIFGSQVHV